MPGKGRGGEEEGRGEVFCLSFSAMICIVARDWHRCFGRFVCCIFCRFPNPLYVIVILGVIPNLPCHFGGSQKADHGTTLHALWPATSLGRLRADRYQLM